MERIIRTGKTFLSGVGVGGGGGSSTHVAGYFSFTYWSMGSGELFGAPGFRPNESFPPASLPGLLLLNFLRSFSLSSLINLFPSLSTPPPTSLSFSFPLSFSSSHILSDFTHRFSLTMLVSLAFKITLAAPLPWIIHKFIHLSLSVKRCLIEVNGIFHMNLWYAKTLSKAILRAEQRLERRKWRRPSYEYALCISSGFNFVFFLYFHLFEPFFPFTLTTSSVTHHNVTSFNCNHPHLDLPFFYTEQSGKLRACVVCTSLQRPAPRQITQGSLLGFCVPLVSRNSFNNYLLWRLKM